MNFNPQRNDSIVDSSPDKSDPKLVRITPDRSSRGCRRRAGSGDRLARNGFLSEVRAANSREFGKSLAGRDGGHGNDERADRGQRKEGQPEGKIRTGRTALLSTGQRSKRAQEIARRANFVRNFRLSSGARNGDFNVDDDVRHREELTSAYRLISADRNIAGPPRPRDSASLSCFISLPSLWYPDPTRPRVDVRLTKALPLCPGN